ncbi:MAG: MazG-like family protein [Limnochordia bacterium]|nr:MazG-like family protein [Limnochordia bacterium]MDD2628626.1 MazG-like family protein [Limnochordia bacterium]MDD2756837.1 MazG-like family protein [Methanothrix sp.]MDD4516957.1 MazG-like family protein [Limnochordia bacterium]
MQKPEINIARNLRSIEVLKSELLSGVAALFRGMVQSNEDVISDSLSRLVICIYGLGRRLGISFSRLDARVDSKLKSYAESQHEIEDWYGDFSELQQYRLNNKR